MTERKGCSLNKWVIQYINIMTSKGRFYFNFTQWQHRQPIKKSHKIYTYYLNLLKLDTLASGNASVRRLEICVLPENGGPQTTNLHGGVGCGGRRYGRGFFINFSIAVALDNTYILSRNLKQQANTFKHTHTHTHTHSEREVNETLKPETSSFQSEMRPRPRPFKSTVSLESRDRLLLRLRLQDRDHIPAHGLNG